LLILVVKIVLQHIPPQRIAAADFERTRKLAVSVGVATRKANGDVEYFFRHRKVIVGKDGEVSKLTWRDLTVCGC